MFCIFHSTPEKMKEITEMMADVGMLENEEKRECKKLIAERENLEEETERLVETLGYSDSCSIDIYGDGNQSPVKVW